jgi:hypothetical protein
LHRRHRTLLHHPHSLHNVAKLISRDKAVSTFWNCTRKPPKREQVACYLAIARELMRLVSNPNYTFSCQYSMSYDISISLLNKNSLESIFRKTLGKGELIFKGRAGSVKHDHHSCYPRSITHDLFQPTTVTYKYFELDTCHGSTLRVLHPAPSSIFCENTFEKPKPTLG